MICSDNPKRGRVGHCMLTIMLLSASDAIGSMGSAEPRRLKCCQCSNSAAIIEPVFKFPYRSFFKKAAKAFSGVTEDFL